MCCDNNVLDCRPAIVSHIVSGNFKMGTSCHNWLLQLGIQLPRQDAHIVHVRFADDCDAPTVPYPSCCVLAPGGFSYMPHLSGSHARLKMMHRLTGKSTHRNFKAMHALTGKCVHEECVQRLDSSLWY